MPTYIYNGTEFSEEEVAIRAQEKDMDIDSYLNKFGIERKEDKKPGKEKTVAKKDANATAPNMASKSAPTFSDSKKRKSFFDQAIETPSFEESANKAIKTQKEKEKIAYDLEKSLRSSRADLTSKITGQTNPSTQRSIMLEKVDADNLAKQKEQEKIDLAKGDIRLKETTIRNDKTYKEASELLNQAAILPKEFEDELNNEINSQKERNGKEYTEYQTPGGIGYIGGGANTEIKKKFTAFENERKQALNEFKKIKKVPTEQEVLNRAAEIYKQNKVEEKLYSQKWDALENLDGYGDEVKKFFIDYDISKKTVADNDLAKTNAQKVYTQKALEHSVSTIEDLKKKLKPAGYEYKTQQEIDEQNALIGQINLNKKEISDNIKYYDKLSNNEAVLENASTSLEKDIELQKKDWNWWSRTGRKIWNSYVNEFGGSVAGALAYADDLLMDTVTRGSWDNRVGKDVARMKQENKEAYESKMAPNRGTFTSPEAFMENAADAVISQLPQIITIALAPEAYAPEIVGLVSGGITGTGAKYTEMIGEQMTGIPDEDGIIKKPDYSVTQLFSVPALFGLYEGGSEYVGGRAIGRMQKMFGKATKPELESILGATRTTITKKAEEFSKNLFQNYGEEIPAEVFNTVLGNFTDKTLLGKKDKNLLDGVPETIFDTAVVSTLFATAPHIAGAVYRPFIPATYAKKLVENNNRVADILKGVDYENLSPEEKTIIDDKVKSIKDSSTKMINDVAESIGAADTTTLLDIDKLSRDIIDIRKQANTINNSSNLNQDQKDQLLSDMAAQRLDTTTRYNRVLDNIYRAEQANKKVATWSNTRKLKSDINLGRNYLATVMATGKDVKYVAASNKELIDKALVNPVYSKIINNEYNAFVTDTNETYSPEQKSLIMRSIAANQVKENGMYDDRTNTIYVNKDTALRNKTFTTARHEVFHKVIENFAGNMGDIGKSLYSFVKEQHIGDTKFDDTKFAKRMQREFDDLAKDIEKLDSQKEAGKITSKEYNAQVRQKENIANEEVSTILTESLIDGDIKIDKSNAENLKFDSDGNVIINNAKDMFNFITAYNESYSKSKRSDIVEAAAQGKVAGELIKETPTKSVSQEPRRSKSEVDLLKEKLEELEDNEGDYDPDDFDQQVDNLKAKIKRAIEKEKTEVKPTVKKEVSDEDEVKEIVRSEKGSVASEKVQKLYEEKGLAAAQDIINLFKPITKRIVDKRRDAPGFDRELLTDEIETGSGGILDLIKSYVGEKGVPLAAYINRQLPLRAIAASRRVLEGDFKKDVTEEKGLMAEETISETKEKPKYKNALESNVFEPTVLKTMSDKIVTQLRTLKSRIDEPISLNRTVTPLIAEIRDAIGKQLDIDVKTAMGGKKDGQLVNWLLKNKRYVLENMTTTWLMGANGQGGIPQAIQKRIDGKWVSYPDWVDQKIDREAVSTDNAGRTSGAELVRRLPNVFNNVSNEDYLGQVVGPDGNPIRGRKESLAKAVSEESAFDIILKDLEGEGEIYDALSKNQERLGYEVTDAFVNEMARQAERGNVKYSKTYNNFNQDEKSLFDSKINELSNALNPYLIDTKNNETIGRIFRNIFGDDFSKEQISGLVKDFTPWLRQIRDITKTGSLYIEDRNFNLNTFLKDVASMYEEGVLDVLKISESHETLFSKANVAAARETTIDMFSNWVEEFGKKKAIEMMIYSGGTFKSNSAIGNRTGLAIENGIVIETGKEGRKSNQITQNAEDYWDNIVYRALPGGKSSENIKLLDEVKKETAPERKRDSASGSFKDRDFEGRKKQSEKYQNIVENTFKYYFTPDNNVSPASKAIMIIQMGSNMETAIRKSAVFTHVFTNPSNMNVGDLRYEHTRPASQVAAEILSAYKKYNGDVPKDVLDSIWETYTAAVIPVSMDNNLNAAGLKSKMNPGWEKGMPTWSRYYNYATFGNPNMFAIESLDPKDKGQIIGEDFVKASNEFVEAKKNNETSNAVLISLQTGKKSKGISVFDFDDTVGLTKSNVLYTMPGGSTGKLNGAEFAKNGSKLLEEGAVFDFSEFSKVVEGRPGPMVEKMKKMIGKFGAENFFILTARPADSALPIKEFLDSIDINIPLENITGLGNSSPQAKADWIVQKANDGYNDFYFADDHLPNVNAVKNALDVLDVKSKIQQARAKFSKSMNYDFNRILEENTGTERFKVFSDIVARRRGAKKGKFDFYVPASAADFELLLYNFMGKGSKGEQHKKFFAEAFLIPYTNGNDLMDAARQSIKKNYKALLNSFPDIDKKLESLTPDGDFTYDQAIRVAIWNESDVEIPGISKRDIAKLTKLVNDDAQLNAFKNGLIVTGRQGKGWVTPEEHWDANTIISDLHNLTEGAGRKKFLGEFIANVEEIFGTWNNGRLTGPNMNKVEALYGTPVREALEDILYRMTTGKNKSAGNDKETTRWNNWVNGSTGTIMFLNTRSAVLQLLGSINFLNFRDNNPVAAAAAFANQPQYWKDWARIWNSDKMKERRGGLKEDVAAAEIANAAAGSKNKVNAVVSYLLKIGYTPTQLADSFAIASGGAPFYRNRIKSYLKEGLTEAEAEAKAWNDFTKVSDETQQSGDPRDISKQQASPAGRLLLTFQNTSMQQARIVKKAFLDLKNRRGDDKTNISKIIYYLTVQNLLFAGLQQGLFAVAFGGDDDDDEKEKAKRQKTQTEKAISVADDVLDTILRGSGFVGGITATLKNMILKYLEEVEKKQPDYAQVVFEGTNISPPIGSKLKKLYRGLELTKYDKDLIKERGWGVMQDGRVHLGPMYSVSGKVVEATTNLPMDRLVNKIENVSQAMNSQNQAWQRIMIGMGWTPYSVGVEGTPGDLKIEAEGKTKRKEEGKIKAEESRERKRDSIRNLPPEEKRRLRYERHKKWKENRSKRKMG